MDTPFGGLTKEDARELIEVLAHPGMAVLRDLVAERNRRALVLLMRPSTTPDAAMFERGAMSVCQGLHEILLDITTRYGEALRHHGGQNDEDGTRAGSEQHQPERSVERGPE